MAVVAAAAAAARAAAAAPKATLGAPSTGAAGGGLPAFLGRFESGPPASRARRPCAAGGAARDGTGDGARRGWAGLDMD